MLERDSCATHADKVAQRGAFRFTKFSFKLEIEFETLDAQNMG
jgi:hypothetical protein